MLESFLEITIVVVLAGIATYDTLRSKRRESGETEKENNGAAIKLL